MIPFPPLGRPLMFLPSSFAGPSVTNPRSIVWSAGYYLLDTHTEDVERATFKLFLRRPSALLRFRDLAETPDSSSDLHRDKLRQICDHPRAEPPPSELPLP